MAPHHKTISTLPQGEREIPSECRYMNQCTNVPNGQTQTYKVESVNALNANRHKSIFIIGVLFLPVDSRDTPYNGALPSSIDPLHTGRCLDQIEHDLFGLGRYGHRTTWSPTTAAHALRFYTEARFILNILIVISTSTKYV